MDRIDKLRFGISTILRILLFIASLIALYKKDWTPFALALFTLFLTFLPYIIKRRYKIEFPSEFEIAIIVFVYASIYLGDTQLFYYKFWWWDALLHGLSGIIIGALGFMLVFILNQEYKVKLSPTFVAFFSFSFAIAIGTVWEIFEFSMDSFFGLNMQKSGLVDTMWDLIFDVVGALIASILGYLYMKKHVNIFKGLHQKFINKNPRLFKKKRFY